MKTEDMWKELLTKMKYEEWDGLELKERLEEVEVEDDSPVNQNDENCKGFILSNLKENVTDQEVLDILRNELGDENLEKIEIKSMGENKKSKLIVGLDTGNVTPASKKLDKIVVDGSVIHCKLFIPATPPNIAFNDDEKKDDDTTKQDNGNKEPATEASPKAATIKPTGA